MIKKYFQKSETIRVQARIPLALAKSLESFKKSKGLSWTQLILGSLQALHDEVKKK